ncbi:aldolase/citrate lyase family protein [Dasania marina]|uniref:aldolase/citrate lyase family protein n=1 Tax=Dasania marina TaxID=471499 RepID=UPI000378B937|nr:aldolase/citrate lyase family protein [Dasania marina]
MNLPINQFKRKLASGKPQFGLWLGLPDSICAEIGAGAGFDWVLIDAEHAPYSLRDIQNHLSAIEPYKVPAIVRPAEGRTAVLKQLLDVGAQTLLIPMVDTAEQARQLVQDVRYPPQGIRGLGTSMARAARWNRVDDYLNQANKEICLIVQAETTTAMQNLAEIVAVDGVDAVFIGPSDLSASMGHIGNPGHPDVVKAIEEGFKTILAAGKAAGVLAVDEALAKAYVKKGASFVGVGVDAALLSSATRQLANRFIESDNDTPLAGY